MTQGDSTSVSEAELDGYGILHLATHAVADDQSPWNSRASTPTRTVPACVVPPPLQLRAMPTKSPFAEQSS